MKWIYAKEKMKHCEIEKENVASNNVIFGVYYGFKVWGVKPNELHNTKAGRDF